MDLSPELVIAVIGLLGTIANYWYTRNKTTAEARAIEADAAGELSKSAVLLVNELQEQMTRQQTRIEEQINRVNRLEHLVREQEATIAEQGAIILQLRERVTHLEAENGRLKIENEQLKQRGSKL